MNARGVLAFMACIVLIGGVAQAAPYGGMNFHEDFNSYEDDAGLAAAWPSVFTAKTTVSPTVPVVLSRLRAGDGCPADPMSQIDQSLNHAMGGVPTVTGNRRGIRVLGDSWTDLNTYKATPGRDMVVDFWFNDVYTPASGTNNTRQLIDFRSYTSATPAAAGFPTTVETSGRTAPDGYGWLVQFGSYNNANYAFRAYGNGGPATWHYGSLARSPGWHHFKMEVVATSATTGEVRFWDITNPANPVWIGTDTAPTVSGAGLAFNVVMFGGGMASTNGEGWLDELRITPEPVSLALLGLGSLLLRRRRA